MKIRQDVSLVEMGRSDVSVCCTMGKVILWFSGHVSRETVRTVLESISRVDAQANCEQAVICDFKDIARYESVGYILYSYARKKGGYLAIFSVPFSRSSALDFFVDSIVRELEEKDSLRITIRLNGSHVKMNMLFDQLKGLKNWEIKNVEYKQEGI